MNKLHIRKICLAVAGTIAFGFAANAMADSTDDIVNALIAKGVLTEEEGALIAKGRTGEKEASAAKPKVKEKNGAFTLETGDANNNMSVTGRLHFDTRLSNISSYGNDRYPYESDTDTKSTADHFEVRRARIGVKGRVGGLADYLLQMNMVGSSVIDEAFVDINKYEPFGIKFGKFKVPFGLEQQTSSNNIDFLERSYVDQLSPAKKMGVMAHGEFPGYTYQFDVFQNNDSALSVRDKRFSTAGRATVNFAEIMGNKDNILHVGLAGYTSDYEMNTATSSNTSGDAETVTRGTVFAFTSGGRGLANAYRMQIAGQQPGSVDAGGTNTDCGTGNANTNGCNNAGYNVASPNTTKVSNDRAGLEFITAFSNVKIQGEYAKARFNANTPAVGIAKADVDTWYAEVMWTLTGEKYSDTYKKGTPGAIIPKVNFELDKPGAWGALEVGLRVEQFNVLDTKITGSSKSRFQGATNNWTSGKIDECNYSDSGKCDGGATTYTAGIKWVLNPNMLFKLSYSDTQFDNGFYPIDIGSKYKNGGDVVRSTANLKKIDSEQLIMLRGQLSF
jgi:phosphate-selective porin OprO/OprP